MDLGKLAAHLQNVWDVKWKDLSPPEIFKNLFTVGTSRKHGTQSEHTLMSTPAAPCQATGNRGYPRKTFRKILQSKEPSVSTQQGTWQWQCTAEGTAVPSVSSRCCSTGWMQSNTIRGFLESSLHYTARKQRK